MKLQRLTFYNALNVYLIDTRAGPVLVDSAIPGMFGWLRRALRRHGLSTRDLAGVVVTHFHIDHVGTALVLERLGVPVYALGADAAIMTKDAEHPGYGGAGGRVLRTLERTFLPDWRFRTVRPLEAGEDVLGSGWEVVPAPGHTPGSLALFHRDTGDLLSGDTLITDFRSPRGPHPLFTPDRCTANRSALALLDLEPKRIHPGHGVPRPPSAWRRSRRIIEARAARSS